MHPIKKTVLDIRNSNMPNKKEYFSRKYSEFKETYPRLFECAFDPEFSLDYLDFMLDMQKKVDKNDVTLSNADQIVYDKLQDVYVKPYIQNDQS